MTGTGGLQRVPKGYVAQSKIPLPPLDVQKEIVAEIEGYQREIERLKSGIAAQEVNIQAALSRVCGEDEPDGGSFRS